MDKKSKILFLILGAALLISVGVTYYRYFIAADYYIRFKVDCDPQKEKCFVAVCDPVDDGTCPAEEKDRTSYYKYVEKIANKLPNCDAKNEKCPAPNCEGDSTCREILCSDKTIENGEKCLE